MEGSHFNVKILYFDLKHQYNQFICFGSLQTLFEVFIQILFMSFAGASVVVSEAKYYSTANFTSSTMVALSVQNMSPI